MKFSKKSRYAMKALIYLAIQGEGKKYPLNVIADRNQIPHHYLEQIFTLLKKSDIVRCSKGFQGGFYLSKRPEEITVDQIIAVVEGDYLVPDETEQGDEIAQTIQQVVVSRINEEMQGILSSISLSRLAEESNLKKGCMSDLYFI